LALLRICYRFILVNQICKYMSKSRKQKIDDLINSEVTNLEKLSEFLSEDIDENELLTQVLKENETVPGSFGERMADKVAEFGGSWGFIIFFLTFLFGWIVVNSYVLLSKPFDPYPFILMNLILSCIAALQAPVIMMSQNRKEESDRKRAQHDYLVNMKAEMEIRNLQINMKKLFEIQQKQLELLNHLCDRPKDK
jgi:uncharacterized membrane protein